MTDDNYTNDEDKYLTKRPTVDKYLEDIWDQDDEHVWESFLKGGNKK